MPGKTQIGGLSSPSHGSPQSLVCPKSFIIAPGTMNLEGKPSGETSKGP